MRWSEFQGWMDRTPIIGGQSPSGKAWLGLKMTYPNFNMLIDIFESADGHPIFSFCLEKSFYYFLLK